MQVVFACVLDQSINQSKVVLPFGGFYQFPIHWHLNGIEI